MVKLFDDKNKHSLFLKNAHKSGIMLVEWIKGVRSGGFQKRWFSEEVDTSRDDNLV